MVITDFLRVVVILLCVTSLYVMLSSYRTNAHYWNTKTRDYWFSRVMWVLVGAIGSLEGLLRNTPFRYTLILLLAASAVTLKGNLNKGSWGSESDERKQK